MWSTGRRSFSDGRERRKKRAALMPDVYCPFCKHFLAAGESIDRARCWRCNETIILKVPQSA